MNSLSVEQIRDRQEGDIKVNRQIWPITDDQEDDKVNITELIPTTPEYREVVFKANNRCLLYKHSGGNPDEINVALLGNMVTLSFVNGQIIATSQDGYTHIIGEISDNDSETIALEEEAKALMNANERSKNTKQYH